MGTLLLLVVFCVINLCTFCSSMIIHFSNDTIETYENATKVCYSINGSLLNYGREIVKAAKQCGMQGLAWLGEPRIRSRGNFKAMKIGDESQCQYIPFNMSNSFECTSLCEDKKFYYIGVSLTGCYCFEKNNFTDEGAPTGCNTTKCDGSLKTENCRVDENVELFEKVYNDEDNDMIRTFSLLSNNTVQLNKMKKMDKLYFFCSTSTDGVFQPALIKCERHVSLKESLITDMVILSTGKVSMTTDAVTLTEMVREARPLTTQKPTTEMVKDARHFTTQKPVKDKQNISILPGIVGNVFLVIIIVVTGAICYSKRRNKKLQESVAESPGEKPQDDDHANQSSFRPNEDNTRQISYKARTAEDSLV